jgi:hypothetical protein
MEAIDISTAETAADIATAAAVGHTTPLPPGGAGNGDGGDDGKAGRGERGGDWDEDRDRRDEGRWRLESHGTNDASHASGTGGNVRDGIPVEAAA